MRVSSLPGGSGIGGSLKKKREQLQHDAPEFDCQIPVGCSRPPAGVPAEERQKKTSSFLTDCQAFRARLRTVVKWGLQTEVRPRAWMSERVATRQSRILDPRRAPKRGRGCVAPQGRPLDSDDSRRVTRSVASAEGQFADRHALEPTLASRSGKRREGRHAADHATEGPAESFNRVDPSVGIHLQSLQDRSRLAGIAPRLSSRN